MRRAGGGGRAHADLEAKLREADAAGARIKLIATDGAFSMDGEIAPLHKIVELAEKYNGTCNPRRERAAGCRRRDQTPTGCNGAAARRGAARPSIPQL